MLVVAGSGTEEVAQFVTVLHRSVGWTERSQPGLVLADADGDRVSQFRHTVESMDGDVHLGRTTLVRA